MAEMLRDRPAVGRLVARADDHANLFDVSEQDLLDEDGEHGFLLSVAIDQRLQRQGALALGSGRDDGFLDLHAVNEFTGRTRGSLSRTGFPGDYGRQTVREWGAGAG